MSPLGSGHYRGPESSNELSEFPVTVTKEHTFHGIKEQITRRTRAWLVQWPWAKQNA